MGCWRQRGGIVACAFWLLLLFGWAQRAPLVLLYEEPKANPNAQENDTHILLSDYLVSFLKELRKVQVVEYNPEHPTIQRLAQNRGWDGKALQRPTQAMLAQFARALGATYLMIVRWGNGEQGSQIEYTATMWQLGRRAPVWSAEGLHQVETRAGGDPLEPTLRTLARTLALRLDTELWANLPTVPESTPARPPSKPNPAPPPATPADPQQEAENLLKEGRFTEAILPLRQLVQRDPTDVKARLWLIDLYRQLGMHKVASEEAEGALEILPDSEPLLLAWVRLQQEQGKPEVAIRRLQEVLKSNPNALAVRLKLFDLLLEVGDIPNAQRTLQPVLEVSHPGVSIRRYLLEGATRQFRIFTHGAIVLDSETLSLWLDVVAGVMTDISNALLDLRRMAGAPQPAWNTLRQRANELSQQVQQFEQWVQQAHTNPENTPVTHHVRFACQLLGQSVQHMARYLLNRNSEEGEQAGLLRVEALRELESARNALKGSHHE